MMHELGIVFVAAGATLVVVFGGLWGREALARRRPCDDVFNYIERPRAVRRMPPIRRAAPARPLYPIRRHVFPLVDGPYAPRELGCPGGNAADCNPCRTPAVCRAVTRLYPHHQGALRGD